MANDVAVVDIRIRGEFAGGHIPNSYGIPLVSPLIPWGGWVVPFGSPMILVADHPIGREEATRQLIRIGYDDRLEVTSSGPLHFGLTAEALFAPHESLPWNPLVARVFFRRGVIESWGRGTIKMMELIQQAGLPTPEIMDALRDYEPSGWLFLKDMGAGLDGKERKNKGMVYSGLFQANSGLFHSNLRQPNLHLYPVLSLR